MSRPLRITYPGAWYHVMNRGRRGENIFLRTEDYAAFLNIAREASEQWNLKIATFCLMTNHYHLLVQTPDANLSRCMRHINGVYTQWFNRAYQQDGQLFRGRYKAVLVEGDSHLLEVMRYIHRNPLNAGLAQQLDDYPWSSHHEYLSSARTAAWLFKEPLLQMVTTDKSRRKAAYLDFVHQGEPQEITSFYAMKKLSSILGGDAFKDWVKQRFIPLEPQMEIPAAQNLAVTPEEVIRQVCTYYRLDEDRLKRSRRGEENLPRDVAIYLARCISRRTLAEIGKAFGISNYSTVSSAIERIKKRQERDEQLGKDIVNLKQVANKSQKQT
jgi:putative transposase